MSEKRSVGRPAGSINKDKKDLIAKAEKLGVDPFIVLLLFTKGDWQNLGYPDEKYFEPVGENGVREKYYITPETRVNAAKEACQYLYPKRKAIELSGDEDAPPIQIEVTPETLAQLVEKARVK